ncbi:S-layer homology domain-containing protein [Candidatus Peregrinibacteria bacterium]|nr:S-layer homology domain-containing protein [Candidatus Peregrinibacteria bacterium]
MKRIILLSLLTFLLSFQTAFASFSDVTDKTDYKKAIDWMAKNGVINGYPDGTFQADKCVNRAEFLKMLFNTLEIPTSKPSTNSFPDVNKDAWFAGYVAEAKDRKTI